MMSINQKHRTELMKLKYAPVKKFQQFKKGLINKKLNKFFTYND